MEIWKHRYLDLLEKAAAHAEREARDLVARGLHINFTLQYLPAEIKAPGDNAWGAIYLGSNPPPAKTTWIKADCEPLRGNVPYLSYFQWLRDRCGNLPVCGADTGLGADGQPWHMDGSTVN